MLDDAVAEVIIKLVSNPKFASMIQEKINMKVDTSAIENEIDNYQNELRKSHSTKYKLIEEIDNLDVEDKHYKRRKNDLDDRLYRMYDKIEELESQLIEAKAKKETIEVEKLTGDNIYKVLIYFDKLYKVMNDVERRQLIEALISEIQIYEEKQPNAQTQPIISQTVLYSGCYGRADINFFAYNAAGKKGVGCGLNNLQKLEDGEALSGRKSAQEVFGAAPVAQQPAQQYQQPQYAQPAQVTQQPLHYVQSEVDPITGRPIVIDSVTG